MQHTCPSCFSDLSLCWIVAANTTEESPAEGHYRPIEDNYLGDQHNDGDAQVM